jgi:kinesin family member 6/9
VFDEIDKRPTIDYQVFISFMEIYNENAYDLLEKKHLELSMEQWNKVFVEYAPDRSL